MQDAVDFFVSYTSVDRPWAEWIAWELEVAGYTTRIQAWDMLPGSNFALEMHDAAQVAERTVAVLSPAFLASGFAAAEWAAAFAEDPTGEQRKLVPVRVRECDPRGLLKAVVYIDVVGLSEDASRVALLDGVGAGRAKPADAPGFPGRVAGAPAGERVRRPEDGAAIFNVPVTTRTFVGRARALEQLGEGLTGDGAVAVTQVDAIHGLGGVGKTQLAARYARVHRHDYDVIWWLRAEQPATLQADLAALAVALGLVEVDVEEADAVAVAGAWLARNARWLLVFDNVTAPEAIAELVPEGEGGHVLITSRAHADWRSLNARPVALDVWERAESRAFLTARTGERDAGVLDELAEALGDLPLALEQAAAYANTKAITVAGYQRRLRDRAPELAAAGGPAGYGHTVATVWSLAFAELAGQPAAEQLVRVCAHLAPERIPRELLDAYAGADEDGAVSAQAVDDAIELLLRYALLTATADDALSMHRLVQDIARTSAGDAACAQSAARAVALIDRVLPGRPWEHERWPACLRLLEHAMTATGYAQQRGVAPKETARVLGRVAQYRQARGQYAAAHELLALALAINEAVHGPDDPSVASMLGALGVVQRLLGEFEAARASQQRALGIKEAVYGPEHPAVASTLGNLGIVQEQLGEVYAARSTFARVLAIFETAYGPEHPEVARTLTNLGNLQLRLGEVEAARVSQQRALAIREAVSGAEHPDIAITLGNLGVVQRQLGELDAARASQQRALAIKEAVYGPEHPEVAKTLVHLGNALRDLGDPAQALVLQERALAIETAVYGAGHHEVAATRGEIARTRAALDEA